MNPTCGACGLSHLTTRHAELELLTLSPDPEAGAHFDTLAAAIHADSGRKCQECGNTYTRTRGESPTHWRARRFCGRSCAGAWSARQQAAKRRAAKIEDLEWIIGTDSPENVARRLGYASTDNLERVLMKWRRHDLAARLKVAS